MNKPTLLIACCLSAVLTRGAIEDLLPKLCSTNLAEQTEAHLHLAAAGAKAARPGAETERRAFCLAVCAELGKAHPSPVVRELVRNLQLFGGEESVPALASMLGHRDASLREEARMALAANPSPAAGRALAAQLGKHKDADPAWTAGIINALGERREAGASGGVAGYLASGNDLVFTSAAKALGILDEPEGVRALARRREQEKGWRRELIDAALFGTERPEIFQMLLAGNEPEAVRAVALLGLVRHHRNDYATEALASGNAVMQAAAIEAAAQRGAPDLYDQVARHLETLAPPLQVQALGVLEAGGNRSHARRAEPLLAAEDALLSNAAAQALAKIGTADSVPFLLACGSPAAVKALGVLDADGVDRILEAAAAGPGAGARRGAAIHALAWRGRTDLLPRFLGYAAEEDAVVAAAAVGAAGRIGDLSSMASLAGVMVAKEASPLAREAQKAVVEIMRRSTRQGDAAAILVDRMAGASPRSQAMLLQTLALVGSDEALLPVVSSCTAADEELRKQAIKLLGEWRNDNALPEMLRLAGDASLPLAGHVQLMRGASRLLAGQRRLDERTAVQALGAARRPDEKKLFIAVLAKANTPAAKAALKGCLADPELKEAAEAALGKKTP